MTSYIQTLQNMCSSGVLKLDDIMVTSLDSFDDVIHTDASKYVLIGGKLDNIMAIS